MELAIVVYLVGLVGSLAENLPSIMKGLICLAVLGGVLVVFDFLCRLEDVDSSDGSWTTKTNYIFFWPKTFIALLVLHVSLPTQDTIKYMGAAYLVQTTYESEFVQEAGSLAGKAITNQLRKWAESNPDIDSLVQSVDETKQSVETLSK
jgi:hypothetical protein